MKHQPEGSLTASRITTLPSGAVAEAVIDEQTACFGRLSSGGSWSPWRFIAEGVRDVSVAALDDDGEPAALVSAVTLRRLPAGAHPSRHVNYRQAFYRLTAAGVTPAGL